MPKLPTQILTLPSRIANLKTLLSLVKPVPKEWLARSKVVISSSVSSEQPQTQTLATKTCEDYATLVRAWKKAHEWSEGIDSALAVMLASSMSTQFVGEQLWIKVIGPPSCGKTSLMEGLATARKWYFSRDTIRGFHSGMRAENEGDLPLADLVCGKTLGIKDGDTLLKAPNLKQILSEGRALYDRVSRTNYRNFVNREYMGHRMTWHLAGTSALREIDDSELGARFLDVVIMDKIDPEFERRVGVRAAMQEARNMLHISDGKPESQYSPELAEAMALTGGYLEFLRTNALEISKTIQPNERALNRCNDFGIFTAHMRARPSSDEAEREFGARLTKQFTRMAIAIAAVLGRAGLDDEVMARVHKVVMDTSRGPTLDLMKLLSTMPQGCEVRALQVRLQGQEEKFRKHLQFLHKIGVADIDLETRKRWRVHPSMLRLYKEVQHA